MEDTSSTQNQFSALKQGVCGENKSYNDQRLKFTNYLICLVC